MHQLNFVHIDIKPENLGFSKTHKSSVFIDFGLSRMVKEEIGERTTTYFTGSMNYCSEEMLELFLKDDLGFVDLYFNDATCLHKTMLKIKEKNSE
jgi:serine/threonine protein kinase